ncbi:ABC transporter permease [Bacillus sp. FJAT-42315]|uniref:ABC transporter permease n=1 Tax=Bacillus sp. FJAT-42315 TaxID=2014077 RepID=UPI001E2FCEEB|nr:ABC transporter permease [Bacillus sp. FJAT-42315]
MMKNIEQLWKSRLDSYSGELRKYLRYMLNDHLLFVLVFGLGALLYYYSGWVKTLDNNFPAPLVMAVILGALLAWSPVYTFLMRADTVFLLPLEEKMNSYFQKAIRTSFFSQIYLLIAGMAFLMPMYTQVKGESAQSFFLCLLVLLGLKIWNLHIRWYVLKQQERESHRVDLVIRLLLNGALLYFLFSNSNLLFVAATAVIMIGYFLYFKKAAERLTLKWETLVDLEEKRMAAFYRFANLFTDVPHLKGTVKRRQWLDPLLGKLPFNQTSTYAFLFRRTFVRMSEYFGLYVRLTMIAALVIGFSDQVILQLIIALLFIYLTGFQLLPMIRRHEMKIWVSLYPVPTSEKRKALLQLLGGLLMKQAIIFGGVTVISQTLTQGGLVLIAGLLFAVVFTKLYAPSRLKKMEEL